MEKRNGGVNDHRRLRRRKFQGKVKWSNLKREEAMKFGLGKRLWDLRGMVEWRVGGKLRWHEA